MAGWSRRYNVDVVRNGSRLIIRGRDSGSGTSVNMTLQLSDAQLDSLQGNTGEVNDISANTQLNTEESFSRRSDVIQESLSEGDVVTTPPATGNSREYKVVQRGGKFTLEPQGRDSGSDAPQFDSLRGLESFLTEMGWRMGSSESKSSELNLIKEARKRGVRNAVESALREEEDLATKWGKKLPSQGGPSAPPRQMSKNFDSLVIDVFGDDERLAKRWVQVAVLMGPQDAYDMMVEHTGCLDHATFVEIWNNHIKSKVRGNPQNANIHTPCQPKR